jgi:hypothetical protein
MKNVMIWKKENRFNLEFSRCKRKQLKSYKLKYDSSLSYQIVIISLVLFTVGYYYNYVQFTFAVAQPSDNEYTNKVEPLNNRSTLFDKYYDLVSNNYPYLVHLTDKLHIGPAIVYEGIVISNESKSGNLRFDGWGFPNDLQIEHYSASNTNISFFTIEGNTDNNPSGFVSPFLNHTERYLSLNFGNIYKYPESRQITIQLNISGERDDYHVFLVNGRLGIENWVDNDFFKGISKLSSHLVDLFQLIESKGDKFVQLNRISIIIEKDTEAISFPFRIDFGKSTVNPPDILFPESAYFINGYIFDDKIISNDFKYYFNEWSYKQTLNQKFIVNSSYQQMIVSNGWDVRSFNISNNNITNESLVELISERTIPIDKISFLNIAPSFDIYTSLLHFGNSKDILFLTAIAFLIILSINARSKRGVKSS